jgi:putative transposase
MAYDRLLKHRDQDPLGAVAVTWCTWERQRILVDDRVAVAVMHSIRDIVGRGHCQAHAYVVMPDHVHCLLTLSGTRSLYNVVRAFKAVATREARVRDALRFGKVWQRGYYEHRIRQDDDLRAQARYIVANPLRAGLVKRIVDYPWWFAEWAPPPFGRADSLGKACD